MQAAYLNQLSEKFSNAGLSVLGVNSNKPKILNQVRPWINKRKISYDICVDPSGKLSEKFEISGFPTLFFVDKNGVIIDKVTGFVDGWEDKYLQSITAYLMARILITKSSNLKKKVNPKRMLYYKLTFNFEKIQLLYPQACRFSTFSIF